MSVGKMAIVSLLTLSLWGCGQSTNDETNPTSQPVQPMNPPPAHDAANQQSTAGLELLTGAQTPQLNSPASFSANVETAYRTETNFGVETRFNLPAVAHPTPLPVKSERVKTSSSAGDLIGYAVRVDGADPRVGLIALPGREGMTPQVLQEADALVQQGTALFVLDYYHGRKPANPAEAARMAGAVDATQVSNLVHAAESWMHAHMPSLQQYVLVGWADGGTLALKAALSQPSPRAVVSYYGDFPADLAALSNSLAKNHIAFLGLFAQQDGWVTPARVHALQSAFSQAGVDYAVESYQTQPDFALGTTAANQVYRRLAREKLNDFLHRRGLQ